MAHFFGTGGAAQLINAAERAIRKPMPPRCFRRRRAPTARSSTTGRAMPAASPASMPSSTAATRSRAPMSMPRRRADRRRRQHRRAVGRAARPSPAPDTAGTTNAFARRPSARPVVRRRRAGVPLAVPHRRRLRGAVVADRRRIVERAASDAPRRPATRGCRPSAAQAVHAPARRSEPLDLFQRHAAGRAQPVQAAAAAPDARRARAVNNSSIIPKIYGERFIKHRALAVHSSRAVAAAPRGSG